MAAVMMRSRTQSLLVLAAVLVALYLVLFAIIGSSMFARAPGVVGLGVTLDLTVTATAVVWWLGVRRKALPRWAAVVTLSCGVAVARRWVPHAPLGALMAVAGGLEVATVGWLLVRIRRVARATRAAADAGPIGALEAGLVANRIPAVVAGALALELVAVWLAVTGWFRRPAPGALTMRSTGWLTIAGLLGYLVIVETVAVHLLLSMWSATAAWIASASSAYALIWLAGDAQAIRLYPVAVVGGALRVTIGLRWRVTVPVSEIASIEPIRMVPDGAVNLALMEPTVLVTLRAAVEIRGLLGKRRRGDRLALTIDDPAALAAAVGLPIAPILRS